MDWSQSYSAEWRIYRVNRDTWADAELVASVDGVDITKTADGDLLESGSMEVTGDLDPDYYRIVMVAEQDGEVERVDVATMLFDVTGGGYDHGIMVRSMDGLSVLYPASRTVIIAGEYAPAGVDGAKYAGDLLADAINAPVSVEGKFTLNEHVVHEIGSTVLEAAWNVLEAGGFVIRIDGRGVVHIMPKPDSPALILDNANMKLLSNGIGHDADMSDIPNRYVVIVDSSRTVAINQDKDSPVSTISRGYCVDEVDESPTTVNGETLAIYANRKLKEASVLKEEYSYKREYAPNVGLYDIVKATITGLDGDLRITYQKYNCGAGITVEEKAVKEVELWQGL